jgi:hypothetical protein
MRVHPIHWRNNSWSFFIKHFLPDGLAMVDQSSGLHAYLTSRPWISSCASMWRTSTIPTRLAEANRSVAKGMLNIHEQNWTNDLMQSGLLGFPTVRQNKERIKFLTSGKFRKGLPIFAYFGYHVINFYDRNRTSWTFCSMAGGWGWERRLYSSDSETRVVSTATKNRFGSNAANRIATARLIALWKRHCP